jgi:DNA-binding XRE family transcriptional regulator
MLTLPPPWLCPTLWEVWLMHLITYAPKLGVKPVYHKRPVLARSDSLAHLFYKLRHNRNLTKRALSRKFGVSEDYLSRVENGSRFPSLSFCLKCAEEFEVNPEYIKNRWANEAIRVFSERLRRRLKLFN